MPSFLLALKQTVSSIFLGAALLTGYTPPAPQQIVVQNPTPILGANISACADFTTSLSSGITAAATSMVVDSLTCGDTVLQPGDLYGFKLGGKEYVLGYVSTSTSNTITYMTRGLSRLTATSSVSSQALVWGRGTTVVQTDAPLLLDIANKIRGAAPFDSPIKYSSTIATSTIALDRNNVATAGLVADTAFSAAGIPNAGTAARGVVQMALSSQAALGTTVGSSGANLVLPAGIATSTYSATASNRVVITNGSNKIDSNFLDTTTFPTLTGINTWTGTSTFSNATSSVVFTATSSVKTGGLPLWEIGKQKQIFTADGTFQVPVGITRVYVRMAGSGGNGGGGSSSGSTVGAGGGGGAGCYQEGWVDVSATSSVKVWVAGGNPTRFSSFLTANNGSAGTSVAGTGGNGTGGAGGSCSGGDIQVAGATGGVGIGTSAGGGGGMGASCPLGGGGGGGTNPGNGAAGTGYCAGGGGGAQTSGGGGGSAGAGASPIVIVQW